MTTSGYLSNLDTYNNKHITNAQSPRRLYSSTGSNYRSREARDIDTENHPVYQYLRKWYESRLQGFSEELRNIFKVVQSDRLIDTMRQDTASGEYINQRVKEIIEDCLNNDREVLLEKMALQCGHLKNEFTKAEHEHKLAQRQQEDRIHDFNIRIERLQEQCKNEVRAKEGLENEIQRLKIEIHNLTKNYEDTLKIKDEQLRKKAEQENLSKQELENRIQEGTEKHWELSQKQLNLQKELDFQRSRNKDQELEIHSLRNELDKTQDKLQDASKILDDFGKLEQELKDALDDLSKENIQLKSTISAMENDRKGLENRFRRITEEMGREQEETIEKIQRGWKEKVEQYKKKITEYKDRVKEKEKEIQAGLKRNEDERQRLQGNIDLLEERLREQRDFYERSARAVEDENNQRLSEVVRRHEDQLKEVQSQFKDLLERKLSQMQEDADEQINQLKKQEKELRGLLDEKAVEIERDHIQLNHHERIVEEKNSFLQKLKDELTRKENEHRQEISIKLKDREERLTAEHTAKEKALKATISDYEQQVQDLNDVRRSLEQELRSAAEERKAINESIEQLEAHKRQLHESIEEWSTKCRKLKAACDDEQAKRNEIERDLRASQGKCRELADRIEELSQEIDEKNNELIYTNKEASNFEMTLREGNKERKRLERDLEALSREVIEAKDTIKLFEENNKFLKEENEGLLEKMREIIKNETDRYNTEVSNHLDTKQKLERAKEKIGEVKAQVEEKEREIEKVKGFLDQLDKKNNQLNMRLEENKQSLEKAYQEKIAAERNIDQILIKVAAYRRGTVAKFDIIRREMNEIKTCNEAYMSSLVREYELQFKELTSLIQVVLDRKERQQQEEKLVLKERLDNEFSQSFDSLKTRHNTIRFQLQEEYDSKFREMERDLQFKDEQNYKLNERLIEVEKELERKSMRLAQVENELWEIKRERDDLKFRSEQNKQALERVQAELKKEQEEYDKQKKSLEEKYSAQIETLSKDLDLVQKKYDHALRKYEEQFTEMTNEQEGMIKNLKKDYEETITQLEASLGTSHGTEVILIEKVAKLEERISNMRLKSVDMEKEKQDLRESYDKKLEAFERTLQEVNKAIEEENQAVNKLKEDKEKEATEYISTIHLLEDELKAKNERIDRLLKERDRFEQHMKELHGEITLRSDQMEKQRRDLINKTLQQEEEIEQLNYLLSTTSRSKTSALESNRKRETKRHDILAVNRHNYKPNRDYSKTDKDQGYHNYKSNDSLPGLYKDIDRVKSMRSNRMDHHGEYTSSRSGEVGKRKV